MALLNRDGAVHLFFEISVIAKAVDGVFEIAGGTALLFVGPAQIGRLVRALTQHELSEDPHDFIAGLLVHSVQHLSKATTIFAAVYLLSHGLIKVGLVAGLLRRLQWAYPTAIAAFGAFLGYQLYRYAHTGSAWLLALSFLDLCVIVLTWLEYRRLRRSHRFAKIRGLEAQPP